MDSSIRSCLIWALVGGLFLGFEGLSLGASPCWRGVALRSAAEAMQGVEQSSRMPSANVGRRIASGYGGARMRV
jgi:hypothetical protein